MKPPLFTYEQIEEIADLFYDRIQDGAPRQIDIDIYWKCQTTIQADPKFREPHK